MHYDSHYDYLKDVFFVFLKIIGGNPDWCGGIISAHGDKCSCYRSDWNEHGIPFGRGVAIYLLTYLKPWCKEVRETEDGWIDPKQWVIDNYERFREALEEAKRTAS